MPPDIIVVNYNVPVLSGFLLWDSVDSYVYMTGKLWPDFTVRDFSDILKRYEKEKPSTN
jgi:undecaprenyl diphosphate synthase